MTIRGRAKGACGPRDEEASAVAPDRAGPCVDGEGVGDETELDHGHKRGACPPGERVDIARCTDMVRRHTAQRPGCYGRIELGYRKEDGHWDAGGERRAPRQEDMRRRTDRTSCCGRTRAAAAGPVGICDLLGHGCSALGSPPNPHCRRNRAIQARDDGVGESHRTRETPVQAPSADALDWGGPKRSANYGASGYGAKSLVETLNQTVSLHLGMTLAPTHHSPRSHHFPSALRNPPRPTENPSRGDPEGRLRC